MITNIQISPIAFGNLKSSRGLHQSNLCERPKMRCPIFHNGANVPVGFILFFKSISFFLCKTFLVTAWKKDNTTLV